LSTPRRKPPVARSAARLGAVQALYQMDLAGTDVSEVLAQFSSRTAGDAFDEGQCGPADFSFLKEVVDGVVREQRTIDPALNRLLDTGWPLERLDATLRAILRAAAYEVMFMENVPARVAITEYLDVAHAFFDEQEPKLLNGVLNTLARQRRSEEF
jgi:transcription antitermination protein NusB